jgi:ribA/ribD-fused uncharacterized protein
MKGGQLPTLIDRFDGVWGFCSNFSPVEVKLWITATGMVFARDPQPGSFNPTETYASVEHAYQAAKFLDPELRERFRYEGMTPGQAKRLGANLKSKRRKDWEHVSLEIMKDLLIQKFSYSILKRKLMSTFSAKLIEGNTWHDNFYGNCVCGERPECEAPGENHLGRLLMEVRTSFIS